MIKIIDGKKYDTAKADLIDYVNNGVYRGDITFYEEELYRTKSGRWFIHRLGGPATSMGISSGNIIVGSETIEPISEEKAYKFLESINSKLIEQYFPSKIEDA